MQEQHFDVFLSHNNKDRALVRELALRLHDEADIAPWLDAWHIPTGSDWEKEIGRALDTCNVFAVFLGENGWSKYHLKESLAAIERQKTDSKYRIIPILLPGAKDSDFANGGELFTHLKLLLSDAKEENFSELVNLFISKQRVDFRVPDGIDNDEAFQRLATGIRGKLPFPEGRVNAAAIRRDAHQWIEKGKKDKSILYTGTKLREARKIVEDSPDRLNESAFQFLEISAFEEQRNKRRQRNFSFILGGIAILAIIATTLATLFGGQVGSAQLGEEQAKATATIALGREEEQTKIARASELANLSIDQREKSFDLSLLLSVEAFHIADTAQSRSALLSNAQFSPQMLRYLWGIDGVKRFPFLKNAGTPLSVAFSPDGKIMASSHSNGMIVFWDTTTYKPISNLSLGESSDANSIDFSPDGKILASGNDDHTIILWDIATLKPIGEPLRAHTDSVMEVRFSPDGKIIASGSADHTVILWDAMTRHPISEPLTGRLNAKHSMAFSPDSKILILSSTDSIFQLNLTTHQKINFSLSKIMSPGNNYLTSVAYSPDGQTIALGSNNGLIFLWSTTTHEIINEPLIGHSGGVQSVVFSPDGKMLISGSSDNSIIIWDMVTQELIGQPLRGINGSVSKASISNVVVSSDGRTLASTSSEGAIILWNLFSPEPMGKVLHGHSGLVTSVAFSPVDSRLASGSSDKTIILWDIATLQPITSPLRGHTGSIGEVTFSPDGRTLASGACATTDSQGNCTQGEIMLWDVASLQPIGHPILGHSGRVNCLAFSPDGKTLASGSTDSTIIFWDLATYQPIGQPLKTVTAVISIAFSPDGKFFASGDNDGSIILWNLENSPLTAQPLPIRNTGAEFVIFSPNSKILASPTFGAKIILWDLVTQQFAGTTLTGHDNNIYSIDFSPDGKMFASGSYDQKIILWDVATLQAIGQPLIGHTNGVASVAFSSDGKILASGSYDKTIILWPVDPLSWIEQNCQRAGRNFTQDEWSQYFPGEPYRITCSQRPAGE